MEIRETSNSALIKIYESARLLFQETGRRLTEKGILAEPAGIYHCAWSEKVIGKNVLYMKDGSLYRLSIKDGRKSIIADNSFYGAFSPDGNQITYTQQDKKKPLNHEESRLAGQVETFLPMWKDFKCF